MQIQQNGEPKRDSVADSQQPSPQITQQTQPNQQPPPQISHRTQKRRKKKSPVSKLLCAAAMLILVYVWRCTPFGGRGATQTSTPPAAIDTSDKNGQQETFGDSTLNNPPDPVLEEPPQSKSNWQKFDNTPGNIVNKGLAAERDGRVYYVDLQENELVMWDKRGQKSVLAEGDFWFINVLDDWVYYCRDMPCDIYRIHTDESGEERFVSGNYTHLLVTKDWIYCMENFLRYGERGIARISTETAVAETLVKIKEEGYAEGFVTDGERLYYCSHSDGDGDGAQIYQMRMDGSEKRQWPQWRGWPRTCNYTMAGSIIFHVNHGTAYIGSGPMGPEKNPRMCLISMKKR